MGDVLRQDKHRFKILLLHMRYQTLDVAVIALLQSRFKEKLTDEELIKFKHTLHLCPTWKIANNSVFKYLKDDMTTPIAKVRARMSSKKRHNYCMNECNFPQLNALCVGAKAMLLKNYVVELGVFNGVVGILESLHFESSERPHTEELKGYVIVYFSNSSIPEHEQLFPEMPRPAFLYPPCASDAKGNVAQW